MKSKNPTVKVANYNLAYSIGTDLSVGTIEVSSQKIKKVIELIGSYLYLSHQCKIYDHLQLIAYQNGQIEANATNGHLIGKCRFQNSDLGAKNKNAHLEHQLQFYVPSKHLKEIADMCFRNKKIIFTTDIIPEENSNLKLLIKGSAQGELPLEVLKIKYPNINRVFHTNYSSGFSIRKVDIMRILKYNKTVADQSVAENLIQFSVQNNRFYINLIHDQTDGKREIYQRNVVIQNLEWNDHEFYFILNADYLKTLLSGVSNTDYENLNFKFNENSNDVIIIDVDSWPINTQISMLPQFQTGFQ